MPGERTERATQHHREEARKQGDILHSRELSSATGTLAGVVLLGFVGNRFFLLWRSTFAQFLELGSVSNWDPERLATTLSLARRMTVQVLMPLAVVMFAVAGAALGAGLLQSGGVSFYPGAIGFKADRINPISNVRNLMTLRAVTRLAKSLVPACALAVITTQRIIRQTKVPPLSLARLSNLGSDIYFLLLAAAWLCAGWSIVDYFFEWQSRESRLKMSRDDLREEMKQTEGNPHIRGRIRGLQRQMRRRRVRADVSKAAVILTNPTHYAIALGFDFATMEAPTCLAKGRNLLAEEIKSEARSAGVPIVEDPPLARSLYRFVEVGQAIPFDLYAAVASILAYLYRQRVEAELRERRLREAAARERSPGTPGSIDSRGGGSGVKANPGGML